MASVVPDGTGYFGEFGGRFVPETLMVALDELTKAYAEVHSDEGFQAELAHVLHHYAGRPTALTEAERWSEALGCRIFLKREDLLHTGAHKINNTLGQILLARRMGKKRIIAETGAGQHGVATATVCARYGLECVVYMGAEDIERQELNFFRMQLMGAKVVPVTSGTKTLKDATNEAIRDWVTNVNDTHYIIGSVVGPHPYPLMVRDFQAILGREARQQILEQTGKLPSVAIACVGGGSNAMGLFHAFRDDEEVRLVGVEAGGESYDLGHHAASLSFGDPGVLHGSRSFLLQDQDGQVAPAHSVSAGLDYPGVGPEHAYLKSIQRAEYIAVGDREALEACRQVSELEGIIPALETAHALAGLNRLAKDLPSDASALVCFSGRGDKDMSRLSKLIEV